MADKFLDLQGEIMVHAGLDKQASTGFYETICPVCENDRVTGGFRFENDSIIYNCFRASCDASCVFERDKPVSRKFKHLMSTIGVKIPAELRMARSSLQKQIEEEINRELYTKHFYKEMKIPRNWTPIEDDDEYWIEYFESRGCDPFYCYVVRRGTYIGAAAIPMYFYDKLIGFQTVHPDGNVKYITHTEDNTHLMMINGGYIHQRPIICDGVMDALSFPRAIGILHKEVSKEQAYFLRGRDVIVFPERVGGDRLFYQTKRYGWKVVIPPWKNVKDLNDCVVKYGKLCTAKMIKEHTYDNFRKAEVAYKLWTKQVKERNVRRSR